MYLKTLTIKGFKSFAQSTTFEFEPGVTAVVGPNGSGKSNVVDALAWVMGEQGAKSLRGGKMEDVIFAGTATRSPLGRAEVVLTIDNTDGTLPIEYTEVTISRTLFRNGTSEYAINGENCRLLDVQELLSDTGLGREMHVIVGQGRLDAILRATPEDRRGFVEEAAGILKHRRRKERTLRKLDAMQANFTRVNDLAGELRRQLKPLGAQAEIAREAQQIQAVVREAKGRLLADELLRIQDELDRLEQDDREVRSQRSMALQEVSELLARQRALEDEAPSEELDQARRVTFDLQRVEERFRSLYSLATQRIALLEQGSPIPDVDPEGTLRRSQAAAHEAELLASDAEELNEQFEQAQARRAQVQDELDALDRYIAEQNALVSRHDMRTTELRNAVEVAASRCEANAQQARTLAKSAQEAAERVTRAQLELAQAQEQIVEPPSREALEEAERRLQSAEQERDHKREQHRDVQRQVDSLAARAAALATALEVSGAPVDMSAISVAGIRGTVAEAMSVSGGFEKAIAAALGNLAEALLVDSFDTAREVLTFCEQHELGRVDVVVSDPGFVVETAVTSVGIPAVDVVAAPEGVRSLLTGTVIVDDLAQAEKALAAAPRTIAVTRSGLLVSAALLQAAAAGADSTIVLRAERDRAVSERDAAMAELDDAARSWEGAEQAVHELRAEVVALRQAERDMQSEAQASRDRANRARARVEAAQAEHARLSEALTRAQQQEQVSEQARGAAERALEEWLAEPAPILDADDRDELVQRVEQARADEVDARLSLETARERARAQRQRAEALAQRARQEEKSREAAVRAEATRRVQREQAERILAALPGILAHVGGSIVEARLQEEHLEQQRQEHHRELSEVRAHVAQGQQRVDALTERSHALELAIHERTLGVSTIEERALNELGIERDVLLGEYAPAVRQDAESPDPTDPSTGETEAQQEGEPRFDREQERARLAAAERKLQRLGRVNPLALEEFAALEQRHKFLTEQLADLHKARNDLLEIIASIDETMQSVFRDAFDDTRAAFQKIFPVLFPGGTGSIELTDPSDPLTTGIEVSIRPAGKKIDKLSLLSGGERSLAAIAFLMAIFTARPSPFYVMDEVEAALDDANLGRLLSVLEMLKKGSQLIIITHQKRTMEIADALYGVSMRRDGVSAVIGQRMSDVNNVRSA